MLAIHVRIIMYHSRTRIYFERESDVCRLPFAVNESLNLSIHSGS